MTGAENTDRKSDEIRVNEMSTRFINYSYPLLPPSDVINSNVLIRYFKAALPLILKFCGD
jgi:hypothetical protein